eukprot:gnl/TRDRNA2_/TRDRNA2_85260_c0_seq3.p2 gnl/TRDRNA2_/TRDRNA2_85260_c0~~gnl/TRDRNA2_/TRDRNA2_85260_c0_seq3.p2  ORF type:complete len:107 (+),score=11.66 gnl/TRDRNA2_/TRDRNA2_85260_c0_seq3:108-428(+)
MEAVAAAAVGASGRWCQACSVVSWASEGTRGGLKPTLATLPLPLVQRLSLPPRVQATQGSPLAERNSRQELISRRKEWLCLWLAASSAISATAARVKGHESPVGLL